jgi:hypothetical protein
MALREARNLVEHHRGIAHLALVDVDDAADLFLGLGALDHFQLAGGPDPVDPVSEILVGHVASLRLPDVFWQFLRTIQTDEHLPGRARFAP